MNIQESFTEFKANPLAIREIVQATGLDEFREVGDMLTEVSFDAIEKMSRFNDEKQLQLFIIRMLFTGFELGLGMGLRMAGLKPEEVTKYVPPITKYTPEQHHEVLAVGVEIIQRLNHPIPKEELANLLLNEIPWLENQEEAIEVLNEAL